MLEKIRCDWCSNDDIYKKYHDKEWGKLNLDEKYLFEMLILEGQQAGLSWITILKKREFYRSNLDNFDFNKISKYDENKIKSLLENKNLIRNKLKVFSIVNNAKRFIEIQKEFNSFKNYLFSFTCGKIFREEKFKVENNLSIEISKDLKKRGFKFVGSKIIYSYLEAIGIMNNHQKNCFLYKK